MQTERVKLFQRGLENHFSVLAICAGLCHLTDLARSANAVLMQ